MTTRTFIFCDICNPDGIRIINNRDHLNNRRDSGDQHTADDKRDHDRRAFDGRRITDGRAWHEGSIESSIQQGWRTTDNNDTLCPKCYDRHFLQSNTA